MVNMITMQNGIINTIPTKGFIFLETFVHQSILLGKMTYNLKFQNFVLNLDAHCTNAAFARYLFICLFVSKHILQTKLRLLFIISMCLDM